MADLASPGALAGRRFIELASSHTAYGGKLLADLGADVVLVEPPGGHRSRSSPGPATSPDASWWFLYANTSKRGVTLDLTQVADRDRFLFLARGADGILEGEAPGFLDRLGLGWAVLHKSNPRLVLTSITGFGQDGPRRDWLGSDLIATALGGAAVVTGYAQDPPVRLAGSHAHVLASTAAASATLLAVRAAEESGRGRHLDISVQETVAAVSHITGVGKWLDDGVVAKRAGTGLFASVPSGAYPCRDGLVYLMVNRPAHWQVLARWVVEETGQEAITNPVWEGPSAHRIVDRELIDGFIAELTNRHTVAEMVAAGQARHLAFTPVQTLSELVSDPQLEATRYFVDREYGGCQLRLPGAAYRHEQTPARIRRAAPTVGEHNAVVFGEVVRASPGRQPPSAGDPDHGSGVLAGLRVVEFSVGMAAPWIGRALARCGADVIKVESLRHPDVTRQYVPPWAPELGVQSRLSPWFTDWNAGKRFVALDLTQPEGVRLAKDLIATADVVVENFTPGVLERLGLGWRELERVKADLIYFGTSGYGDAGPSRSYVTWGPNLEAASGLATASGFPGRACTMTHFAYPDSVSALHGLFAILAALDHRRRTGQGQRVSLSQLEATISVFGDVVMESLMSERAPVRRGNRRPDAAPHGCYPCRGEDRWCAIAVFDDEQWERLCEVAGRPPWARDERFSTAAGRLTNVEDLERRIEAWTRELDAYALQDALQAAGVPAGVVQTPADRMERDPQFAARGFFERLDHELKGSVVADGIPLDPSLFRSAAARTGAAVGADNDSVFGGLLGVSSAELRRFRELGAIEDSDEPTPELP